MKRITFVFIFTLCSASLLFGQGHWSFKGTVTKMRMMDCAPQHGLMTALSGVPQAAGSCPEYTIMGAKVVYTVVGRRIEDFIPLAEDMEFVVRKNELVSFSDDEKIKVRFIIQQMTLRANWEREEERKELAARIAERSVSYETRNPSRSSVASANIR